MATALDIIAKRREGIKLWLKQNKPDTYDHKHLDDGTSERSYYHLGYVTALNDCLRWLGYEEMKQ